MSHKADAKAFQGKGYRFHVVRNGSAVAGFVYGNSAERDANSRNAKAVKLGIDPAYKVESVDDCEYVVS